MFKAVVLTLLFLAWVALAIGVAWPILALRGTIGDALIGLVMLLVTFGFYAYVAEAWAFAVLKPPIE